MHGKSRPSSCLSDRAQPLPFFFIRRREPAMSFELAIPLGIGFVAAVIAVIKRRASAVTTLHIYR
jgi:hypothetical protein